MKVQHLFGRDRKQKTTDLFQMKPHFRLGSVESPMSLPSSVDYDQAAEDALLLGPDQWCRHGSKGEGTK